MNERCIARSEPELMLFFRSGTFRVGLLRPYPSHERELDMAKRFEIGDHVAWNSEVGS